MELQKLSLWIKVIGRLGALLGVLALLLVVDAFMDGIDRSANIFSGYPGMSQPISGKSSKRIKSIQQLSYTTSSKGIALRFAGAESSVWHNAWHGTLEIGTSVEPDNHTLSVSCLAEIPEKRITQYKIHVYKDVSIYKSHHRSYIRRYWGVPAWWICLSILPFFGLCFVLAYYLSSRKAFLMAALGRTEIFKLKQSDEDSLISFGLGRKHGVQQGDLLSIYSPDGAKAGTAKVRDVFPKYSVAISPGWQKVKPGYEIRLFSRE
jgi:hypothetical protein